ncbi:hypothetical protein [Actinoplanes sp. M2I2]|uniref:hypothetical protein n=1 Tax=Actinoplanes sp. M2I2 TaxID=1734444 RepID=UPI0020226F5B|nr:hypothetical protein [Actinoplanes sp. M2I2]
MRSVQRLTIATATTLAAAIGVVAASSPASAADASDVANCFYGVGIYDTNLGIPRGVTASGPVGPGQTLPISTVVVNGNIDVAGNTSCSEASVQFRLQTKECGTFRCTWRTKAEDDTVLLPVDGRATTELRTDCRIGTHSYRLQAVVTHVELTFEDNNRRWYPMQNTITNTHEGLSDKISC